jgi:TatD DNase family protein
MAHSKAFTLPSDVFCAATHGEVRDMTPYHKKVAAMTAIDIHTHNSTVAPDAIFNSGCSYIAGRSISIGLHPWHINDNWKSELANIAEWAKAANVVAIGECGFDMLKSPADILLQEEIFLAHAQLSEALCKPLIIHCVKAFDRLMSLHKEQRPRQAWIIHGFRGKPQLAVQLIDAGFYISLGERFNPDSAKAIPTDRLFIESDESPLPIADIYTSVAEAKEIPAEQLALEIMTNARIFRQF